MGVFNRKEVGERKERNFSGKVTLGEERVLPCKWPPLLELWRGPWQTTSLVLTRKFLTDVWRLTFLGELRTTIRLEINHGLRTWNVEMLFWAMHFFLIVDLFVCPDFPWLPSTTSLPLFLGKTRSYHSDHRTQKHLSNIPSIWLALNVYHSSNGLLAPAWIQALCYTDENTVFTVQPLYSGALVYIWRKTHKTRTIHFSLLS